MRTQNGTLINGMDQNLPSGCSTLTNRAILCFEAETAAFMEIAAEGSEDLSGVVAALCHGARALSIAEAHFRGRYGI